MFQSNLTILYQANPHFGGKRTSFVAVLAQNTCVWGFRLAAAMAIVIATAMDIAICTAMAIAMAIAMDIAMAITMAIAMAIVMATIL